MARPYSGRPTCERCKSIDIRRWHREGRLRAGQAFSLAWTDGGQPPDSILVRTEDGAAVLMFWSRRHGQTEWPPVVQRVPIDWTACRLGGRRPWFICSAHRSGRNCGLRVAVLYGAGGLFACRRCYGLVYASQQKSPRDRNISRARKIRMRLGGGPSLFDPFPVKPKGMHRRTYLRLQARARGAEASSLSFTDSWLNRLKRPIGRRG